MAPPTSLSRPPALRPGDRLALLPVSRRRQPATPRSAGADHTAVGAGTAANRPNAAPCPVRDEEAQSLASRDTRVGAARRAARPDGGARAGEPDGGARAGEKEKMNRRRRLAPLRARGRRGGDREKSEGELQCCPASRRAAEDQRRSALTAASTAAMAADNACRVWTTLKYRSSARAATDGPGWRARYYGSERCSSRSH